VKLAQLSQRPIMKNEVGFQFFASLLIVVSKMEPKSGCVET
jgi:hypothetical protein